VRKERNAKERRYQPFKKEIAVATRLSQKTPQRDEKTAKKKEIDMNYIVGKTRGKVGNNRHESHRVRSVLEGARDEKIKNSSKKGGKRYTQRSAVARRWGARSPLKTTKSKKKKEGNKKSSRRRV